MCNVDGSGIYLGQSPTAYQRELSGHLGQRSAKIRTVMAVDCKGRAGNCQIVGIRDVGCGRQIGRGAHAFQNRKSHE